MMNMTNIDHTDSPPTPAIDPGFVVRLRERAEAGDPKAMFDLGCLHDLPAKIGVELDLDLALHWYTRSAEAGFAWAQFALGNMCELAQGTPRNDLGARRWYEAAARQGIAEAQMHLGRMLQTGRGGPAASAEAADWYQRAAHQGHERAATNLALMHLQGEITPADLDEARRLLEFAADKLDGLAHLALADMHLQGVGTPRHGGLALAHYCVAALLLPAGPDAERAIASREGLLARQPALRESYHDSARQFIDARTPSASPGAVPRRASIGSDRWPSRPHDTTNEQESES
jgi:TPR repeat protein